MMKQMNLVSVALVVVFGCVLAVQGGVPSSKDEYDMAPPSYYTAGSPPPMPPMEAYYPSPISNTYDQQQQQQQQVPKRMSSRLANHLIELGRTGIKSTKRMYQDAKPALNNIKGDFGEMAQRVRENPHVVKVVEATKPRVMGVVSRAQPLVNKSGQKLSDWAGKAQAGIQQRMAGREQAQAQRRQQYQPESVYPVPPPGAYSSE